MYKIYNEKSVPVLKKRGTKKAMTNLLRTCPPNGRDDTGQQCSYSTHLLPIGSHSKQFNRVQCVGRFHQLAGMINGLRH